MNIFTHDVSTVTVGACLLLLLSLYLHHQQRKRHGDVKSKSKPPPAPEPSGSLPVIGHLHLLRGQDPAARTLGGLADKLGPIFSLQLGTNRALVISSWEAVKDCFTTNDAAFSTRPLGGTGKYLGYDYAAFAFGPYGPHWRYVRKIVTLQLLSNSRLESLKHIRISEVEDSIKELYYSIIDKNNCVKPVKVVISKWFEQLSLNFIVKTIAGKRYINTLNNIGDEDEEAKHFRSLVDEYFIHAGNEFLISDHIAFPFPLFRWICFCGSIKNMKRIAKEMDTIFQSWIDEHVAKNTRIMNKEEDFIDVMLSVIDDNITHGHGYSRETTIKATIMTLIIATADTTKILATWLMSLLLNNRHVMKRAQEEIDNKIGKDRWVQESDINNLSYLQAIVKETLRLYPPGPLAIPHQAMEDCEVGGYFIPKGTHLLINIWKLHRDPRIWAEPDKFNPDRFLTAHAEVDIYGRQFEYIPFGTGRRSCPGGAYAMQVTYVTIARLLQGFDFSTPTPSELPVDMKESQGLTLPKANPLELLITPRLPAYLYGDQLAM